MTTRNEVHINSAFQLLQARKNALDRMNRTAMRAHGRVLGKDVFTWFDFQNDELVNTILSFPYPVHWVAKKDDVLLALRHSKELIEKFRTIAIYDASRFELSTDIAEQIDNCISNDSMQGALIMMKAIKKEKGALLITGETSDWHANKQHIEEFLNALPVEK